MITGAARVFALLGDPVDHSLSPVMQNAAFQVLGLPAVYVALRCTPADVPGLIRALVRAGGGGNVTVPHKETALRATDHCRELAEATGACNTFGPACDESGAERRNTDGNVAIMGDNTDVPGLIAALQRLMAPAGPPEPWLIAGTGGGARAAVIAARTLGAAVAVTSRSAERQRCFEEWIGRAGVTLAPAAECRLLLNTTPQGLRPDDPLPLARDLSPQATVAFDMVYRPGETTWVRAMRAAGLRAADGREMLVAQGAAALEQWFPGATAPVEVMRAAVAGALR